LAYFMAKKPQDIALTVVGEGSNILIRDGGIKGVVVLLGKGCDNVTVTGARITAEAGANSGKVARTARTEGLTGGEFLCGIPGSVGGAVKMNAGAYNTEVKDILDSATVLLKDGTRQTLTNEELGFGYRHSSLPDGAIVVEATFNLKPGDKDEIREKMRQINRERSTSQPLNMPSSGSWFKNHVDKKGVKTNAWKLVDKAGCRGLKYGNAQVSEKHCNFFVNLGGATAADMEKLSTMVEEKVHEKMGIKLGREVRFIGEEK